MDPRALNASALSSVARNEKLQQSASIVSVHEQPLAQQKEVPYRKLIKRYRILTGCGLCQIAIGMIMFLALTVIIQYLIQKNIDSQVLLSRDNEQLWAHYPGDTGTVLTRNYSFFSMTNEQQFLLHKQKPKFKQVMGYKLQEFQDFYDIQYRDNDNRVYFKDWLHFQIYSQSRDIDQYVKTINVPYLGYWFTLKKSRDAIIFLQAFSMLLTNIQNTIIDTVIAQGVKSQYVSDEDKTKKTLLYPAGIDQYRAGYIWNDVAFGLNRTDVSYWIHAAKSSFVEPEFRFSSLALNLQDYFNLSDVELLYLVNQFKDFAESINQLIIQNHYCQNIKQICDGHQLAVRQIANSSVTNNTPPVNDIKPTDTICENNSTCLGHYPEIKAYYDNIYQHVHKDDYDKLTFFDVEIVRLWLDYNITKQQGEQYNKGESTLLHIGNLDYLFENGKLHDEAVGPYNKSTTYLKNIGNRFHLQSDHKSRVFWQWIKYLVSNFTKQQTKNNQRLGVSNTFSSEIMNSFYFNVNNLQNHLLRVMIKQQLINKTLDNCTQLLKKSFIDEDNRTIQNICKQYNNTISDIFLSQTIDACKNKYQKSWKKISSLGTKTLSLANFCDKNNTGGFGQIYDKMRIKIRYTYNCSKTGGDYCSDYQLALLQWTTSKVTNSGDIFNKSTTYAQINPQAKPTQYYHYWTKYINPNYTNITIQQAYKQFNFDNIFSAPMNIKRFRQQANQTNKISIDYIRYVVIFVGFKGMNNQRKARQHILGYDHQYLLERKNKYPPFGGDPSISSFVAFNDVNVSKEEVVTTCQWFTGKDNIDNVGQYYKINNLTYMATNYTIFDGNKTYWQLKTPWKVNDYFYGTNGKKFKPHQVQNRNISIYVPNLQRYGTSVNDDTQKYIRYGYEGDLSKLPLKMYQSQYDNKQNQKYYQDYEGLFNQTSVFGIPFFMSKHYLLNTTTNWSDFIEFYTEAGERIKAVDNHWQDSFVISQPYTGVSFQSALYLQANFYYTPDFLFTNNQTCLLPVFSVYRSGNLTQKSANKLFGPLFNAVKAKNIIFIIGIVIAAIGVLLAGFGIYKLIKLSKERKNNGENKESEIKGNKESLLHSSTVVSNKKKNQDNYGSLNQEKQKDSLREKSISDENL